MKAAWLAVLLACTMKVASPIELAMAQESAEVVHHLTVAGQRDAMKEIADRFKAAGGIWIDNAIAPPPNTRREYSTRMIAGNPPTAYTTATNRDHNDYARQGLLDDLEAVASKQNWRIHMAPEIINSISAEDGKIYTLPLALNVPGFVFYNKPLFEKLGIAEPKTFDESFFAVLDKLKTAGVIPLAYSADAFNVRFPFESVMLALGGRDLWYKVWRDRSKEAIRGAAMRHVLEAFIRLRDYTDDGAMARVWNLSSDMVSSGRAGVQIMGDWAIAEYLATGLVPGKTLGCFIPGKEGLIQLHSTIMAFPRQPGRDSLTDAQTLLATIAASPDVQTAFNAHFAAVPPRLDAEIVNPDPCLRLGIDAYRTPGKIVANPRSLITSQMDGEYRDAINEFWSEREMTIDEVVDRLVEALHAR